MKPSRIYLLARRLSDDMVSRGSWDTQRAEQRVSGFYKFNPPGVRLDPHSYAEMREIDPGLPQWPEFLALLDNSEFRRWVHA